MRFNNWNLEMDTFPVRQYDNLTRRLEVSGDIPGGWSWVALLSIGDNLNIISLQYGEPGLYVDLTADMIPYAGRYNLQLKATQGEKVRHTNIVYMTVNESMSGDVQWPELPSEFSQAEQRITELNEHPPQPGDNGFWLTWNVETDRYEESDIPLPSGDAPGGAGIDDDVIAKDSTWSSRQIVDTLAPEFEASGAVVTCTPVAGYPLHVVSQITPVQEGDGDPSPDNVRPIVGWSRSNLWVGGKNLLSLLDYTNITNGPIVKENEIIFSKSLGFVDYVFQNMKPGQYTVSLNRSGYIGIQVIVGGKEVIINGGSAMYKGTFTVAMDEAVTISLSEGQNPNGEQRIASDVMLTFGDHSAYERYKQGSDVKFMSFGQTVYGGTLDWMTGVLTVDWISHTFNAADSVSGNWQSTDTSMGAIIGITSPGATPVQTTGEIPNVLCASLKTISYGNIFSGSNSDTAISRMWGGEANQFAIRLPLSLAETAADIKSWLIDNAIEVVYQIANPITIQLTPTEILALSGTNTLYTDTGDTTVSGRADPNAVINNLAQRIAALESAAVANA